MRWDRWTAACPPGEGLGASPEEFPLEAGPPPGIDFRALRIFACPIVFRHHGAASAAYRTNFTIKACTDSYSP